MRTGCTHMIFKGRFESIEIRGFGGPDVRRTSQKITCNFLSEAPEEKVKFSTNSAVLPQRTSRVAQMEQESRRDRSATKATRPTTTTWSSCSLSRSRFSVGGESSDDGECSEGLPVTDCGTVWHGIIAGGLADR